MRKLFLTFLSFLLALGTFAAEFTAKVSNTTVEVGQRFQVSFTINDGGGSFIAPDFKGFSVVSGPIQSSSRQNINGKISRSQSISYILIANEEGEFTIGSARIKSGKEVLDTKPIKIKVTAASATSTNAQRTRQTQRKAEGQALEDYVFMRAVVNKRSAYVGENIGVTYKVYSKIPLRQFLGLEQAPSLTGFWQKEIEPQKNIRTSNEYINGEQYETVEIQKLLLLPQRSGELIIDPMAVKLGVQVKSQRRSRSIFDQLMGSYEVKEVIVESKPITINVKALPQQGKPIDFTGAVGDFTMKMSINKDSVTANDAIDLKAAISGSGNLPLINSPKLNFPPDFEVYDPETKNEFSSNFNGSNGRKTFNYLVIPRHSGDFELEPFQFSYFDLKSKSYKTISAPTIHIAVAKGDEEESVVYKGSRKSEVEVLNDDIRYIHINNLSLFSLNDLFYGSGCFYLYLLLFILLMGGIYFYAARSKAQQADQVGLRKSKANKLAKKRLSIAQKHLQNGKNKAFYEEISTALFGYFADKFNLSVADLSQERIIELLSQYQNANAVQEEVKTVLSEAEMARFAPSSEISPNSLYERAVEIISKTEALS